MKFKNYSTQNITIVDDEYIRVDSSGIITTETSIYNFLKINKILIKTGIRKLLLNTKFENDLKIDQLAEIYQRLESIELHLMFDISAAIVPLPERYDEFQVYVTTAKSYNIDIELFTSLESAILWLKSKC